MAWVACVQVLREGGFTLDSSLLKGLLPSQSKCNVCGRKRKRKRKR
jgi:hypothetical protein